MSADSEVVYVYGDAGDDTIINNGLVTSCLDGGEGDDIIINNGILTGRTVNNQFIPARISGGAGDDTYIINTDLSNLNTIYDGSGENDILSLTGVNKDDLVLRFSLEVDDDGNIVYYSRDMYITSLSDFGNAEKGIKITDQFVEGRSIETITTADNYALTTTEINQLREHIAGWLHTNGFESVQQVLNSGDPTNIDNLIAQFQTASWQPVA